MSGRSIVVHRDATLLARAVAARLVTGLVDAQAATGSASVVLTGGGMGIGILAELRAAPARDAVDWRHLDVWWGDERYLPAGHPDRNETQARAALLDAVDVDPARVHAMPPAPTDDGEVSNRPSDGGSAASSGATGDPEVAAARYAEDLAAAARPEDHGPVPTFDILLLGVGPDGHVASLFPETPAAYDERSVVAVRGAPKPPPIRLSLTLETINAAREVWLVASGAEKATAIHLALSGAGAVQVPAAGVRGRSRTLWLLDRAAARALPPSLARPASP